ncbi:MAG: SDR family oxidoreductase [Rubrivivax sp.]|nr:SDR family oxidoreductase [Rubrivivax sp.]MDP3085511.1 SDR family oxidoreductase [Rubrivivax sp.]
MSESASRPRQVLIVGASSAIGCELVREIADPQTTILAHCHQGAERLLALQPEVASRLLPLQADLSTAAGIDSLLAAVQAQTDCPDAVVLLAAPRFTLQRFKDLDWDDFRLQVDLQLQTAVRLLGRYLPRMAARKQGKVVFMLSSYTSGTPPAAMAHYVTGKYAMLGLMKALAAEYAGKKLCINAVSPSMIETPFLADIPGKIVEINADNHPRKRNGLPTDVAPVLRFLLSPESDFMTGVNVPVTGGL